MQGARGRQQEIPNPFCEIFQINQYCSPSQSILLYPRIFQTICDKTYLHVITFLFGIHSNPNTFDISKDEKRPVEGKQVWFTADNLSPDSHQLFHPSFTGTWDVAHLGFLPALIIYCIPPRAYRYMYKPIRVLFFSIYGKVFIRHVS